jgi:hypothetical protein
VKGDLSETRKELARLARQPILREIPFGTESPTKWWFGKVIDPRTGKLFTSPGAWDFVAETAEDGRIKIKEKDQNRPPGCTAYQWVVDSKLGKKIFIKVILGKGKILGRSFHYNKEG